mmetsp:Transcript_28857/g.33538  ORF Transcript_28857/g.33538 Transcript_28857/m.33538 type:complete len:220 (+) Transcript_28857:339-998(+)
MLESYRQGALIHFFDIISTHQTHRYWHYGITLPSNNSNSLAAHLKLSDEEYMTFMTGIHIDCKKDNYHVIQSTIALYLNKDLKTMKESKLLLFKKVCGNGLTRYTCQIGKYDATDPNPPPQFVFQDGNNINNDDGDGPLEFVKACSIRVLFTGDLAWYAVALGKVNMAPHWCCWCKLSKNEWKEVHKPGEEWMLLSMNELREQLNRKTESKRNRGYIYE